MGSDVARGCDALCSLPPHELQVRVAMIRREIAPLVVASHDLADGREWCFANSPEIRAAVERLIELERRCCRSITFELGVSETGTHLTLSATGSGAADLFARAGL